MAAEAEAKISGAIEKELDIIDKQCLRSLQVKAFLCSAKCCEDKTSSQSVLQGCMQHCMEPVRQAEETIKSEINQIQDRLTRCSYNCQDVYKDALPATGEPTSQQLEAAKKKGEQCIVNCADTHLPLIPKMIARCKASLSC
ncbi:protein FAM136A-like [Halichondria panicea]|uniref:protein FAM136A-like n=1 Tax=Halichondria panicea TaxID=6063 RepID=UPI00312B818D